MTTIILDKIVKSDFEDIKELTANEEVMKFVGNSQTWNDKKINNFINYCIEDDKKKRNRDSYYYKIVMKTSTEFIGIIGFHKFNIPGINNEFFLTIYINPKFNGMGMYKKAFELLTIKMKSHEPKKSKLYIMVRKNNERMNTISNKNYKFIKEIIFNREQFNIYVYSIISNKIYKTMKKTTISRKHKITRKYRSKK
jgi:RimJ/RimL family protein N-acetyltransferase